jgi:hypothetical protein
MMLDIFDFIESPSSIGPANRSSEPLAHRNDKFKFQNHSVVRSSYAICHRNGRDRRHRALGAAQSDSSSGVQQAAAHAVQIVQDQIGLSNDTI